MSDLLSEQSGKILSITFNRVEKNNAFDDQILADLCNILEKAEADSTVQVIILKANGKHFSAGADLNWMKRMAEYTEAENLADAKVLADVMHRLHKSPKPTIAVVQGAAYGGGAGLAAACDIAIAADTARFCFSEVKLGLIPAVISPYVVNAIGSRAATWLFTSAEVFDAKRAYELQLVQHCVPEHDLLDFAKTFASNMATLAPEAVKASKYLVQAVSHKPIDEKLIHETASLIAKKRVSKEGQVGLQAFLNKQTPVWD